jgi:hypothetical protein
LAGEKWFEWLDCRGDAELELMEEDEDDIMRDETRRQEGFKTRKVSADPYRRQEYFV